MLQMEEDFPQLRRGSNPAKQASEPAQPQMGRYERLAPTSIPSGNASKKNTITLTKFEKDNCERLGIDPIQFAKMKDADLSEGVEVDG